MAEVCEDFNVVMVFEWTLLYFRLFWSEPQRQMKQTNLPRLIALFVLLGLVIGLFVWRVRHGGPAPQIVAGNQPSKVAPISEFNFESDVIGWMAQTYPGSEACIAVSTSQEHARTGTQSLKLDLDLIADDQHKSNGEAFATLASASDFAGRTVTAWVYAPKGSRGSDSHPNGFQLFVKDKQWHSEYGTLKDIPEDQWVELSLVVGTAKPENGWVDADFNPQQAQAVGIKIVAPAGSQNSYKGPVYLDDVSW
jgi:hypothetical protein